MGRTWQALCISRSMLRWFSSTGEASVCAMKNATDKAPTDTDKALRLAKDPSTPAATLRRLQKSRHARVLAALTKNPNTPLDVLLTLLPIYPRQFLSNPALPLLLLERPSFFAELPDVQMYALLCCEKCLPVVFAAARTHQSQTIRDQVEQHVLVLGEAGADWQAQAEACLARSDIFNWGFPAALSGEAIPAWIYRLAILQGSAQVWEQVARHPDLPGDLLIDMSTDVRPEVRMAAARHPHTPPGTLRRLALEQNRSMRVSLLSNPALPDDVWRLLLFGERDRSEDAPELFQRILQEDDTQIRQAIAGNPQTPPELLELLAGDAHTDVRRNVALNPQTPLTLLIRLMQDRKFAVQYPAQKRLRGAAVSKPISLREQVKHLAYSNGVSQRFVALASPVMPARFLWQWLQPPQTFARLTDHWAMRYAIARNSSAHVRTLNHLAHDGNRYVRAAARDTLAHHHAGSEPCQ